MVSNNEAHTWRDGGSPRVDAADRHGSAAFLRLAFGIGGHESGCRFASTVGSIGIRSGQLPIGFRGLPPLQRSAGRLLAPGERRRSTDRRLAGLCARRSGDRRSVRGSVCTGNAGRSRRYADARIRANAGPDVTRGKHPGCRACSQGNGKSRRRPTGSTGIGQSLDSALKWRLLHAVPRRRDLIADGCPFRSRCSR